MSVTKLQDKPIVIGNPIEIEYSVNELRKVLSSLSWIDKAYFIAQKFIKVENGRKFYFPETYATEGIGNRNYKRLTPDNDFKGMLFFLVGRGKVDFQKNSTNFIEYQVSIIFSVNLEKINSAELDSGIFTQRLISEARKLLTSTASRYDFEYSIDSETRDLKEVYSEFVLDENENYHRAPMQTFRFNLTVKIQEDCFDGFDWCSIIRTGTTIEEKRCLLPTYDFDDEMFSLLTDQQKTQLTEKLSVNNV